MHPHQLLHQQLGRIWNLCLHHMRTLNKYMFTVRQFPHINFPSFILAIAIKPHILHTCILNLSETVNSLSFNISVIPCEITQSLSIYPKRRPPERLRP